MTDAAPPQRTDVVVVGGGNAAFCAAHAARARGRRVVLLEKAPPSLAGGNSYYTAGATRFAHGGLDDLRDIVEPDDRHGRTEVPPYSESDFAADLAKVTDGRNDPDLTRVVTTEGIDTVRWLHGLGLRYRLMYERQSYERADGTFVFWGGLHVGNVNGGIGLIEDHTRAATDAGVDIRYEHAVTGLVRDGDRVIGVRVDAPDGAREIHADTVVLAAGGFESDAGLRQRFLGDGWQNAKVRGTPYNTGELLVDALEHGAQRGGDWSTCHSVAWDAWNPENESNRTLTNRLTRQSYPLGIVVNTLGRRFLDEGADFRNYTYAKYGREILAQPGSIAFQVFDHALRPELRTEEYDMPGVSVVQADTLEELADGMGVDAAALVDTVTRFNDGIDREVPRDTTVLDGRASRTSPPKSNWASPIETAPFYAYPVTCGITFTFGGLRADVDGRALDAAGRPIPGLLVAGEMLGGLFSGNYPGGSGLIAGSVFGRRAGAIA